MKCLNTLLVTISICCYYLLNYVNCNNEVSTLYTFEEVSYNLHNSDKYEESNSPIQIINRETSTLSKKKVQNFLSNSKSVIQTHNINIDSRIKSDQTVFWQGWIRYYHYSIRVDKSKPHLFFQNNAYFSQRIPRAKLNKHDEYGLFAIPNKAAFFLVLYENSLSIFQSRDDILQRAVDTLKIDFVNNIPEDSPLKGGVTDIGEYKIGSCFEVSVKQPNSFHEVYNKESQPYTNQYWTICMDKRNDKAKLMSSIIRLKVNKQRTSGQITLTHDLMNQQNTIASLIRRNQNEKDAKEERERRFKGKPKDGYWILLQDWTDCTLKCGGGASYQQWMCVPPKFGGKDCEGPAIKNKPCNTQPCPEVSTVIKPEKNKTLILQPIVKTGRFTLRPQRYSKCQIKENDAFLATYDPFLKADNKLPIRLVMNNSTVAVYKDETYNDHYYTYDLKDTSIYSDAKNLCCLFFRDNYKRTKLCSYNEYCEPTNKWVTKWISDFNLFKNVCRVGLGPVLITKQDIEEIDRIRGDEDGEDQYRKMKATLLEDEVKVYERNIKDNQKTGLIAIQKENLLEKMIKTEEQQKEQEELEQIRVKIEEEKKKASCLQKQVEERDLDTFEVDKRDNIKEAEAVKARFALQIQQKRIRMKKELENMRRRQRVKRIELENELKEVRSTMAMNLIKSKKIGNIKNCIEGIKNLDFRSNYCNKNFIDEFSKNSGCKQEEEFCSTCCETEFGNFYMKRRYECYDICDKDLKKNIGEAKIISNGRGLWKWAPRIYVDSFTGKEQEN